MRIIYVTIDNTNDIIHLQIFLIFIPFPLMYGNATIAVTISLHTANILSSCRMYFSMPIREIHGRYTRYTIRIAKEMRTTQIKRPSPTLRS